MADARRTKYLLDPRFQLKWTGYLVVVVVLVMAGLGYVIARTAGRASDTASLAVKEAERDTTGNGGNPAAGGITASGGILPSRSLKTTTAECGARWLLMSAPTRLVLARRAAAGQTEGGAPHEQDVRPSSVEHLVEQDPVDQGKV